MKELIFEIIQKLSDEKKAAKKHPDFVLDMELHKAVKDKVLDALRELYKERRVDFGKTLNNNFVEILPEGKKQRRRSKEDKLHTI